MVILRTNNAVNQDYMVKLWQYYIIYIGVITVSYRGSVKESILFSPRIWHATMDYCHWSIERKLMTVISYGITVMRRLSVNLERWGQSLSFTSANGGERLSLKMSQCYQWCNLPVQTYLKLVWNLFETQPISAQMTIKDRWFRLQLLVDIHVPMHWIISTRHHRKIQFSYFQFKLFSV